ncbi:DUF5798 family protein [Halovivax limisalsi]|uniref:DUF5798 family protein n=1 Tax=Halovivax limisalsi TaxID=1453760 RepID=UPI001FFD4A1B|nr:DUF5798 family protein [Halovivax limisalsi]
MGLGSTAKKIQLVSEKAEQMYKQVQELQQRIIGLEGAVEETHDTVTDIETDVAQQRALLEALAEERGLDTEAILAEAAIDDAEGADAELPDGDEADATAVDERPEESGADAATSSDE